MSYNNFTKVDLFSSKSLYSLELCHNKIIELRTTNNYPSLSRLDISNNQLETLDFTIINLPSLETLLVGIYTTKTEHNRIRQIITNRSA
jgi:Leucine-rich repeat (LRR) protein